MLRAVPPGSGPAQPGGVAGGTRGPGAAPGAVPGGAGGSRCGAVSPSAVRAPQLQPGPGGGGIRPGASPGAAEPGPEPPGRWGMRPGASPGAHRGCRIRPGPAPSRRGLQSPEDPVLLLSLLSGHTGPKPAFGVKGRNRGEEPWALLKVSNTPAGPAAHPGLEEGGNSLLSLLPWAVPTLGCAHPRTHLWDPGQAARGTSRREFKEYVMEQRDCGGETQCRCSRNTPLASRSFFWLKFGGSPASQHHRVLEVLEVPGF